MHTGPDWGLTTKTCTISNPVVLAVKYSEIMHFHISNQLKLNSSRFINLQRHVIPEILGVSSFLLLARRNIANLYCCACFCFPLKSQYENIKKSKNDLCECFETVPTIKNGLLGPELPIKAPKKHKYSKQILLLRNTQKGVSYWNCPYSFLVIIIFTILNSGVRDISEKSITARALIFSQNVDLTRTHVWKKFSDLDLDSLWMTL